MRSSTGGEKEVSMKYLIQGIYTVHESINKINPFTGTQDTKHDGNTHLYSIVYAKRPSVEEN